MNSLRLVFLYTWRKYLQTAQIGFIDLNQVRIEYAQLRDNNEKSGKIHCSVPLPMINHDRVLRITNK